MSLTFGQWRRRNHKYEPAYCAMCGREVLTGARIRLLPVFDLWLCFSKTEPCCWNTFRAEIEKTYEFSERGRRRSAPEILRLMYERFREATG